MYFALLLRPHRLRQSSALFWLVISVVCAGLSIALLSLNRTVGTDSSVYALIGERVISGLAPYREVWEIKPPGLFALSALSAWISELIGLEFVTGWRVVSALSVTGLGIAVAGLLRSSGVARGIAAMAGLSTTVLFSVPMFSDGGGLSEPPAIALGALAWWWATARPKSPIAVVASSILTALAVSVSFTAIPLALMTVGRVVVSGNQSSRIVFVAAGSVVPLGLLGWIAWHGALADMWRLVFEFNRAYLSFDH